MWSTIYIWYGYIYIYASPGYEHLPPGYLVFLPPEDTMGLGIYILSKLLVA